MTGSNKTNKYTQDDVYKAVTAVNNGMSLRQAEAEFKVPRSTISAKKNFTIPIEARRGSSTILTAAEENIIEEWIFYCASRGCPVTKRMLLQCVKNLVEELDRPHPFKDKLPGRSWYRSFLKRHPKISRRMTQNLTTTRVSATAEKLSDWFSTVKNHLEPLNLINIDPSRIYNLDESAFFLYPKGEKVLAPKGSKAVYKVVHGDDKECITVMFTVNAAGTLLPPLILYWYERIPRAVTSSLPATWLAGTTESGWQTADSFFSYIKDQFHPWLICNNIQLPVILYLDGHKSHMTPKLAEFCRGHGIECIGFYPNATHVLQPLDVAVFHPMKVKWSEAVDNWRMDTKLQRLKRENFAPVLKNAIDSMENIDDIIKNGFSTCGLSPFNPEAVNYNILEKNKKYQKKEEQSDQAAKKIELENQYHLVHLQKSLDEETLKDFKNAVSNGNFQVTDTSKQGLFEYWLHLSGITLISTEDTIPASTDEINMRNQRLASGENSDNQQVNDKIQSIEIVQSINDISELQVKEVPMDASLLDNIDNMDQVSNLDNDETHDASVVIETYSLGISGELINYENAGISNKHETSSLSVQVKETESKSEGELMKDENSEIFLMPKPHLSLTSNSCTESTMEMVSIKQNISPDTTTQIPGNGEKNKDFLSGTSAYENSLPDSFKRSLTMPPEIPQKKMKLSKKAPLILTSEDYQKFNEEKDKEELKKQKEKTNRQKVREEKKIKRMADEAEKKAINEQKKTIDEQIKQLMEQKKALNKVKKEKTKPMNNDKQEKTD